MRRIEAWMYLACIFAVFWVTFAIMLIFFSNFPFVVISIALLSLLMLSLVIIGLAWAYTHDY
jgi:hypothetical protein